MIDDISQDSDQQHVEEGDADMYYFDWYYQRRFGSRVVVVDF